MVRSLTQLEQDQDRMCEVDGDAHLHARLHGVYGLEAQVLSKDR